MIYLVVEELTRHWCGTNYRAFNKKEDAIAYMKMLASADDSDWILLDEGDDYIDPCWRSDRPIHSNAYEYEYIRLRQIELKD